MRLKELRNKRGLSQREIASKLDIAQTTYSFYEIETRKPDPAMLIKLAEFFNVSTDYLLAHSPFSDEQLLKIKEYLELQLLSANPADIEEMNEPETYHLINEIIAGNVSPTYDDLVKIADVLGGSLDEMLGIDKEIDMNNLSFNENSLVSFYRQLDEHGKEVINNLMNSEYKRMKELKAATKSIQTRPINLYALPVSAGPGIRLPDDEERETIFIPLNLTSQRADFVLNIAGDSMEPDFSDGDLILIAQADQIEVGELGVFSINGEAFFKRLGENQLESLNPKYPPIKFDESTDVKCLGRVLGKTHHVSKGFN